MRTPSTLLSYSRPFLLPASRLTACRPLKYSISVPITFTRTNPTASMSTSIQPVSTTGAPPIAAPYSQAIIAGNTIYCSGQIPATPDGKLVEGSIGEMTKQCLLNLKAVVEQAGSSPSKIVKCVIFITDMANFDAVNEEYGKHFSAPLPARSCVAVKQLPKGVPVEIECVAVMPDLGAKL